MLHLTTQESPMAGPVPVQALQLWPVTLGLLAPVAMCTRCPSSRQSHAGLALDMVFCQHCLFTWDHATHAPRSAGQSGDVVAAACSPASAARAALGRVALVKLLLQGGTWLFWGWRGGFRQEERGRVGVAEQRSDTGRPGTFH